MILVKDKEVFGCSNKRRPGRIGRLLKRRGRFKCQILKGSFCTDLCPNTLHKLTYVWLYIGI